MYPVGLLGTKVTSGTKGRSHTLDICLNGEEQQVLAQTRAV